MKTVLIIFLFSLSLTLSTVIVLNKTLTINISVESVSNAENTEDVWTPHMMDNGDIVITAFKGKKNVVVTPQKLICLSEDTGEDCITENGFVCRVIYQDNVNTFPLDNTKLENSIEISEMLLRKLQDLFLRACRRRSRGELLDLYRQKKFAEMILMDMRRELKKEAEEEHNRDYADDKAKWMDIDILAIEMIANEGLLKELKNK